MSDEKKERELRHELANAEQEKNALQGMLKRAADELDKLAEADCDDEAIEKAETAAKRFRRASSV
ncbi:hypothetical protein GRI39_06230 [Altererythrobacter indicus]|uniref:Uncharacterized protein n=1 Tax=Altericroceibacterium indicum TaxID=374177 RepID=A0A845AEP6_9SPHN|nr:hypothetical protein [Altericroceibacterium indicum]MXP25638.1 hypothetical protein [Altericroceibacterium indicum]